MRQKLPLLAAIVLLAAPSAAHAGAGAVIRDCADDGTLQGKYSDGDLRRARDSLPSDLDEYSDCREVINGAIGGPGGRKGSGGGGRNSPLSPAARQRGAAKDAAALEAITRRRGKPSLGVGGRTVEPGANGLFNLSTAANGLPLPLLLALVAAGLLAAVGATYGLRRRVPALANLTLPRIPLPRVRFPRLRR